MGLPFSVLRGFVGVFVGLVVSSLFSCSCSVVLPFSELWRFFGVVVSSLSSGSCSVVVPFFKWSIFVDVVISSLLLTSLTTAGSFAIR